MVIIASGDGTSVTSYRQNDELSLAGDPSVDAAWI